jgi:hypothetical protein
MQLGNKQSDKHVGKNALGHAVIYFYALVSMSWIIKLNILLMYITNTLKFLIEYSFMRIMPYIKANSPLMQAKYCN